MSHAVDGTYIKAQQDKMVNSSLCKKASVDTYFNVMEVGNDSNLLIVFYVQIMPDDFVMQLHRF
ncbi:hypothetical protein J4X58_23275 [Escherichia coli]